MLEQLESILCLSLKLNWKKSKPRWRRRSGRLPARYSTIYDPGEMVDEDMARMLELGYYVAEEGILPSGARHVIYRLGGVSAL